VQITNNLFVGLLKKRYGGTLLRAWKVGLDVKARGRLSYHDLSIACQSLGIASQTHEIWKALRNSAAEDASLLEFAELAPEEAANVDSFAEQLVAAAGPECLLVEIWSELDPDGKGLASLTMFKRFAKGINFRGDVSLLFNGLAGSGRGQIDCEDLSYVWKVSKKLPVESLIGAAVQSPKRPPKAAPCIKRTPFILPVRKRLVREEDPGVPWLHDGPWDIHFTDVNMLDTQPGETVTATTACQQDSREERELDIIMSMMMDEYGEDQVHDAIVLSLSKSRAAWADNDDRCEP
jgi:Ca2+-binding EF-hand superfamily protein